MGHPLGDVVGDAIAPHGPVGESSCPIFLLEKFFRHLGILKPSAVQVFENVRKFFPPAALGLALSERFVGLEVEAKHFAVPASSRRSRNKLPLRRGSRACGHRRSGGRAVRSCRRAAGHGWITAGGETFALQADLLIMRSANVFLSQPPSSHPRNKTIYLGCYPTLPFQLLCSG